MATRIITKNGSGAPLASDLQQGELAVDLTNKRLYTENASGTVLELGTSPSTIDINAGTIDGTVIGGSSAAAGSFTSITGTSANINGTVTADGLTVDGGDIALSSLQPKIILTDTSLSGADKLIVQSVAGQVDGDYEFVRNNDNTAASDVAIMRMHGATGDLSLFEDTGTTAKFFWDASAESLGIGTSSPSVPLDVVGNGKFTGNSVTVNNTTSYALMIPENTGGYLRVGRDTSTGVLYGTPYANVIVGSGAYPMLFGTNNTERARLDASGNWLLGKSSLDGNTAGFQVEPAGAIAVTRSGSVTAYFNRQTSDGDIAVFRKDGTTVGSIGTIAGRVVVGSGDTALGFGGDLDAIYPATTATQFGRDNAIDLGDSGTRFKDLYATNGTIQTSDRNEKQDIEVLSEAEQRVAVAAKGLLRKFRWKDAVEEKGDDARIHFGIIAQDLQAAFEAEGLDAGRYAMFIHSTWTDEETGEERSRMGVRYSELLAFIIAAI